MIVNAVEPFSSCIEEAKPLLEQHWAEINVNGDIPLDPDYTMYPKLERFGMLITYTVRDEGKLVGYAAYITKAHPHYQGHKWALSDIFWLHPSARAQGVGNGLFAFIEDDLRTRGVHVMHTTTKRAHPQAGLLLERRGHSMIELGFSKRLDLTGGDQHGDSGTG